MTSHLFSSDISKNNETKYGYRTTEIKTIIRKALFEMLVNFLNPKAYCPLRNA